MRKLFLSVLLLFTMSVVAQDNTIRNGGEYFLYNTHYGRCLGGNAENNGPALSVPSADMSNYVWVVESSTLDDGWFWLRHKQTGKYLQASNATGNTWSCWFAGNLNKTYNSYEWQLESGVDGYVKSYRGTVVNSNTQCYLGIDTGQETQSYINVYYDKTLSATSTWQIVDANFPLTDGRLKLYTDELDEAIAQGEAVYNNDLYGKPDELAVALYNARSARETASLDDVSVLKTATTALLAAISNAQEGKYKVWISGSSFGVGASFTVALEKVKFVTNSNDGEVEMVLRNTQKTGAIVYIGNNHIRIGDLAVNDLDVTSPHDYLFSFNGSDITLYVDGTVRGTTRQSAVSAVTSVGTSAEWTIIGDEMLSAYTAIIYSLDSDFDNISLNKHGKYDYYVVQMLGNTDCTLSANADYHFLASSDVVRESAINITNEDSWVIFDNVRPSDVIGNYLKYIKVNGSPAVNGTNCRVAIYLQGAVVYPFKPDDVALYGYSGELYGGTEYQFRLGANDKMGEADNELNSFVLKRGYMVCLSTNSDGSGYSRVYVADHEDKRIDVLPDLLRNRISRAYVRKWNWVSKKGWCSTEGTGSINTEGKHLGCTWFYTWGADRSTQVDMEYVPHKGHVYWPSWSACNQENATAVLGYNEPDHSEQHSDACGTTIDPWTATTHQPEFMECGLRIGSPSPTDASWLTSFIKHCDDMSYRCDFVAFHAYWGTNEAANSDSWWAQLNNIYKSTGRTIWLTEWNNGASWTTESWPSSYSDKLARQKNAIKYILSVLDNANFIERYSLYNWDSYYRAAISWDSDKNSWWVTPCGEVYRDSHPTHAYNESMQKIPVGWFPSTSSDNNASFTIKAAGRTLNASITNKNGDYTLNEIIEYYDDESKTWKTFYDNSKGRNKFESKAARSHTISLDDCVAEALLSATLILRLHITTLGGGDTVTNGVSLNVPSYIRNYYANLLGIDAAYASDFTSDVEMQYFNSDGSVVEHPVEGKVYIIKTKDGQTRKVTK